MVESELSLAAMSQFLFMVTVSCLPTSEKMVIIQRVLVSVGAVRWDNR